MLRRRLRLRLIRRVTLVEVSEGGELGPVAAMVCTGLVAGDVIFLHGPIGAGKTTLVQACARELGITEPVTSPTFALAHRYRGRLPVSHLDLYRLEGQPERDPGDLQDAIAEDGIAFVEWPEYGAPWLPPATCRVTIAVAPDGTRQFEIVTPDR